MSCITLAISSFRTKLFITSITAINIIVILLSSHPFIKRLQCSRQLTCKSHLILETIIHGTTVPVLQIKKEINNLLKIPQLVRRRARFYCRLAVLWRRLITTLSPTKGKSHLATTFKSDFSHCGPESLLFGVVIPPLFCFVLFFL